MAPRSKAATGRTPPSSFRLSPYTRKLLSILAQQDNLNMTAWLEHHIAREAMARGIDCEKVRKEVSEEA